jgi:predicted 3-demethylubiquinone-9 3-methyltransferase (glyoxalase superfamily)
MSHIVPCLWMNNNVKEAIDFYTSVFKNAKVTDIIYWPDKPDVVLTATFRLDNIEFCAINGNDQFKFNESISFQIHCETQEEADYYYEKLVAGGQVSMCGWLKDKFGMSWQCTPVELIKMVTDPDRAKATRAMQVMMTQQKIDLAPIRKAFEGK